MAGVGLAIIGVALIFALAQTNTNSTSSIPLVDTPSSVQRFASENDIILAFQNSSAQMGGRGMMAGGTVAAPIANQVKSTSEAGDASSGSSSSNYSTTNVQVEGVDEADIVKTDGKNIYSFFRNRLVITKAFPANEMTILTQLELKNITPQEMFIRGNQLILFGSKYDDTPIPTDIGGGIGSSEKMASPGVAIDMIYPPYYWNGQKSIVYVYDVSNPSAPTLEKELEFTGSYVSGRMIENIVYFVVTSYPNYSILADGSGSIIPMVKEDGVTSPVASAREIGYISPIYAQQFITLGSLNLDTEKLERETIVGSAEHVYASAENMYITHTIWNYWNPLPIGTLVDSEDDVITKTNESFQKTVVYKFALNEGNVDYRGYASIPGRVLDQFSMDEYQGNVRIATTIDQQWDYFGRASRPSSNNVYVLNEDMRPIGSLTDLAKGETIYSARFMEERAYMVTFKKVDPLFVIDLSNPENPSVLGKLKIPGYSDYLHPMDATHLIGIGKDAIPSKEGDFAWYAGMKMAVFDVSDVENPVQQHSIIIGDRGTDSVALQDHKAFLYDAEKELLVLPIYLYEITDEVKKQYEEQVKQGGDWESFPAYGVPTYQGAFVYTLNLENGFVERGRITHVDKDVDLRSGYYSDWEYQVQRSLFMDNTLYTVSQAKIKANDLTTLSEISSVEFPQKTGVFTISYNTSSYTYPKGYGSSLNLNVNQEKTILDMYLSGPTYVSKHAEVEGSKYYSQLVAALDWDALEKFPEYMPTYTYDPNKEYTQEYAYLTVTNGDFSEYRTINPDGKNTEIKNFLNALKNVTDELSTMAEVVPQDYPGYPTPYAEATAPSPV